MASTAIDAIISIAVIGFFALWAYAKKKKISMMKAFKQMTGGDQEGPTVKERIQEVEKEWQQKRVPL